MDEGRGSTCRSKPGVHRKEMVPSTALAMLGQGRSKDHEAGAMLVEQWVRLEEAPALM